MTTLDQLVQLIPPPAHPLELADSKLRKAVERILGFSFPNELREFAVRYGSGVFRDGPEGGIELTVFNPAAPAYLHRVLEECNYLQQIANSDRKDDMAYDVYPKRPGLFPWGQDNRGDDFFWLIDDSSSSWAVIVRGAHYEWARVEVSLVTFLMQCVTNSLKGTQWDEAGFFADPSGITFEARPLVR
jgi:hypothetical protein